MYRLIGYADCTSAILEESDNITTFTGSVAEIIDTYPEYTSLTLSMTLALLFLVSNRR